ncbi:MAG: DUF2959 family protein [Thermoanaerobaculia bacterium]|nr:DUF2959 family protein [Thermoanaerobaculia bacterium]
MPRSTAHRHCLRFALVGLAALAPLAASLAAAPPEEIDLGQILTGQPPGVRQTERLAKKADAMIDDVEKLQTQVRATLTAQRNLVFGAAADLRKPYRALDREIGRTGDRREAVRRSADQAKAESTDYFRAWAGSLPLIEDDDLRGRSEERLRDSRARFDGIVEAGRRAAQAYEPFLGRLRDQWNYLGHDLNPSGIESLRPDAQKLAEEGDLLLAEIDDSLRQAREYVASIRSRQPPPPPPPPAPPAPAPPPVAPQ